MCASGRVPIKVEKVSTFHVKVPRKPLLLLSAAAAAPVDVAAAPVDVAAVSADVATVAADVAGWRRRRLCCDYCHRKLR
jgi:hypothetical protein